MRQLCVGLLAVTALWGCGEGVAGGDVSGDQATVERALMPACVDANCPNSGGPGGPPDPAGLPQDPIPIHTGRVQQQLESAGQVTRIR